MSKSFEFTFGSLDYIGPRIFLLLFTSKKLYQLIRNRCIKYKSINKNSNYGYCYYEKCEHPLIKITFYSNLHNMYCWVNLCILKESYETSDKA